MCGIGGIIKKDNKAVAESSLKALTDIIQHRGPDDEGFYVANNVGFGHRRLAILDLSKEGHQPMHYLDKYVITYNGEIYNYIEIKNQLSALGYNFKSKTDTEVILAAYDYWGEDCTQYFNGMWAFAIHNKVKNIVFCSRDRFGVKPFYYFDNSHEFVFGSEIKQFTTLQSWQPKINGARVLDFLMYGITNHTAETLFEGVIQLKGGHNLIFDLTENTFNVVKWYDVTKIKRNNNIDFDTATNELKIIFEDAVRIRLRSDVKVGSCLSGGIDSSSIVCTMKNLLDKENKSNIQETVSSCFAEKKFDEQEFIDEVIAKTGVKSNKVFPKFEELFTKLPEITWHQDEPFSSTSIFAQWNVFAEAKKHSLTVMLDGQGADESLGGYASFQDAYHNYLFRTFQFKTLVNERRSLQSINNKLPEVLKSSFKSAFPKFIKSYLRNNFISYDLKYILPQVKNSFHLFSPQRFYDIYSLSLDQITATNIPMLLHFEDRDSMAHSIESRVPFLDYRFVEYVLSLPDEFKIRNGISKFIFREAMTSYLPEKVKARRDKMGFVTPEQLWIKNNSAQFRKYLENALNFFEDFLKVELILADFDFSVKNNVLAFGSIFWRIIALHQWAIVFKVDCSIRSFKEELVA